jgi:hypothetical protein
MPKISLSGMRVAITMTYYKYPNWKKLCKEHAKIIMGCPCYIVEKSECEECVAIKNVLDRY